MINPPVLAAGLLMHGAEGFYPSHSALVEYLIGGALEPHATPQRAAQLSRAFGGSAVPDAAMRTILDPSSGPRMITVALERAGLLAVILVW